MVSTLKFQPSRTMANYQAEQKSKKTTPGHESMIATINVAGMIFVYGNSLNPASPCGMRRLARVDLAGTLKTRQLPSIFLDRSTIFTAERLILSFHITKPRL